MTEPTRTDPQRTPHKSPVIPPEGMQEMPPPREIIAPGILAGAVAAAVMALFAMIVAAATGNGFLRPMKLIAAVFLGGQAAMTGGAGAVILGLAIHMAFGIGFGLIFAALLPRDWNAGVELGAGLVYGVVVFLLMTYIVVPWSNPFMAVRIQHGWFFLYHLAFGATLVLVWPFREAIRRGFRARPPTHAPTH